MQNLFQDPVLIAGALVALGLIALALVLALKRPPPQGDPEALARLGELEARLRHLAELNQTTHGQLGERLQAQERQLTKNVEDRLADLSRRVGESLTKQQNQQMETMGDLKERLATITAAQETITKLSQQVVSLQDVLTNKQARGAFGEVQLNDLVTAALPPNAYKFQATLSNGKRVDCLLDIPNPPGPIAVDAKFPLESYYALRQAGDEEARTRARRAFGQDVLKHVTDIAERYIVHEETADSALMFMPSEAVYAELHAELPDIVEKSHRLKVYIVSPTTLMATLNTIRAVLKDAQMQEQAHILQKEIRILGDDVGRLDQRVGKLRSHFDQANKDITDIETSTRKITSKAGRIDKMQFGARDEEDAAERVERAAGGASLPGPEEED